MKAGEGMCADAVASRTRGALRARAFENFGLASKLRDAAGREARRLDGDGDRDGSGCSDSETAPTAQGRGAVPRAIAAVEDESELSELSELTDTDVASTDDEDSDVDLASRPRPSTKAAPKAPAGVAKKKARGGRGRAKGSTGRDRGSWPESSVGDEPPRKKRKSEAKVRKERARRSEARRAAHADEDAWDLRHLRDNASAAILDRAKTAPKVDIPDNPWSIGEQLRSAGGAYISTRDDTAHPPANRTTPESLRAEGLREVEWDGKSFELLTDAAGLVFGALVGSPAENTEGWVAACRSAHQLLLELGPTLDVDADHRRGKFPALNAGVSFGGGQRVPGCLVHGKRNAEALEQVMGASCFQRIAGHQSRGLQIACPKVYAYAHRISRRLYRRYGNRIRRPFRCSVYPTCAFNFGPCVRCKRHRDFANSVGIPCAITALGDFDPTKGAHLILYDLGTFVRFPPGSTILLLSAPMDHGNTATGEGETRTSFTQYFPGGLARHVEWKFRTWKQLPDARRRKIRQGEHARLGRMIARLSKA